MSKGNDGKAAAANSFADQFFSFIQKKKYLLISILSVAVLLLLWVIGSALHWFNPAFIPPISAVWGAFTDTLEEGYKGYSLLYHIGASMKRLFIAVILAFAAGSVLGIVKDKSEQSIYFGAGGELEQTLKATADFLYSQGSISKETDQATIRAALINELYE